MRKMREVPGMNNKKSIPITSAQAFECLYINIANRVPSILTSGFYYGTDLDLPRVEEILNHSENNNKLFLSDILGGELRHDITAWIKNNKNGRISNVFRKKSKH